MERGAREFTMKYHGLCNKLLTSCLVSAAWLPQENASGPPLLELKALWDTGATASVITQDVAAKLELIPEGITEIFHVRGREYVPYYFVNLVLPNRVRIARIKATQGILPGCDVLIGMDIINRGDFAVSNRRGKTMFSFRLPSMVDFDFVSDSQNRGLNSNQTNVE